MKSTRLLFPLLLLVPAASAAWLVSHAVPGAVALTVCTVALLLVITALEQWRPFSAAWNNAPSDERRTDLVYIALASVPDRLTRIAVEALGIAVLGAVASPERSLSSLRAWAVGVAAFVVADLIKYALHRAAHEQPWLWRFHFAHHQPQRLVATNALRLHPVNIAWNGAADAVVAVLFGVAPDVAAVLATLRATVAVLQHANVDLDAQRQWLVNAPSYHRLHHAVDVSTASHNFASTLLVWDRLFGTLLRGPAPDVVGIATPHRQAQTYRGQFVQAACTDRLDTTCALARWPWLTR